MEENSNKGLARGFIWFFIVLIIVLSHHLIDVEPEKPDWYDIPDRPNIHLEEWEYWHWDMYLNEWVIKEKTDPPGIKPNKPKGITEEDLEEYLKENVPNYEEETYWGDEPEDPWGNELEEEYWD